ncbi:MAG: DUF5615 family PIN-like protein [Phycisphaerae bacterium]
MKFLIDRCAGRRLADWLVEHGHDALYAGALGRDPGDPALLSIAAEQGRILITIDTDFGKLIFVEDRSHCGLVRLPDVPAPERIALLDRLLTDYAKALEAGAIITVRGERIRISRRKPED